MYFDDQDLEKAVGYFLTNQSKLPEAKRTLSKSELLADIKQSFRNRLLEHLKRYRERDSIWKVFIHNLGTFSPIAYFMRDMEYVNSIYSLRKMMTSVPIIIRLLLF